jgi:hypothetical protein
MSGARSSLVDAVERIGVREGLAFGTPLYKPFRVAELIAIGNNVLASSVNHTASGARF